MVASHAWWVLLVCAMALLWTATSRRIDRVEAMTDSPTWSVDAPRRDAASPTGYEHGQRKLIVPGHHNPSFLWIMEAQRTVEQGSLRLRRIDYDAQPDGRETRRTSHYRWWLIATGCLHSVTLGGPLGYSIERGALVADPLLLAMMIVVGSLYCARFIGSFAAAGFVIGAASLFPLAANFQPGAPDPRSLAWVLALGCVLPLFAALRMDAACSRARNHFVAAGVIGGLGFWNDATSQAPVLLAITLAAIGCEVSRSGVWSPVFRRGLVPDHGPRNRGTPNSGRVRARDAVDHAQSAIAPSHWRSWAAAGALATLFASLFEFAPNHFSWSLDAVSPVHAVTWWGVGELLHAAAARFRDRSMRIGKCELARLGVAVIAVAAWPVVAIATGTGGLLASDFYAHQLANHPAGGIAANLVAWLARPGGAGAKWATLLPCFFCFAVFARLYLGKAGREEQGHLVFVLAAALGVAVLALFQLRWWNLFDVFVLVVLVALFAEANARGATARLGTIGWSVLLVPGLVVGWPQAVNGGGVGSMSPIETQSLVERDYAWWLNKRRGEEPVLLYSTPIFSGAAAFYGGFNVVVSGDEENETGRLAAVRIASAITEQESSILVKGRGVTHVALPLWDPALERFVRSGLSVPANQQLPGNAFAVSLQLWDMPVWMGPMDYLIPNEPRFQGFEVRAFALLPDQEPDLALGRLADFFVERGQMREALSVRESLAAYPRSVHALGAIANIDLASRDGTRLEASLKALIPQLSRRSARNLPADRRISLAALLVRTKHPDLAREQFTACLEELDVATLRTLTPGSVISLLALSRSLDVPIPDAALESTAFELVPPEVQDALARK